MQRHERHSHATIAAQIVDKHFKVEGPQVGCSTGEDFGVRGIFARIDFQNLDLLVWPSLVQICLDRLQLVLITTMDYDIEATLAQLLSEAFADTVCRASSITSQCGTGRDLAPRTLMPMLTLQVYPWLFDSGGACFDGRNEAGRTTPDAWYSIQGRLSQAR